MKRKVVSVVYDRRKEVETKGAGNVEIFIRLTRLSVKKIIVNFLTPSEWEVYKDSAELSLEVSKYEKIVSAMELLKEDMTVDNLNKHLGIETNTAKVRKDKEEKKIEDVKVGSFLDFMRDEIIKERSKESTKKQKLVMSGKRQKVLLPLPKESQ